VLVPSLVLVGVLLLPLPALVTGCRGLLRRPGLSREDPSDRASFVVLVSLRVLTLVLVFLLSGITLLSAVGAMIRHVDLHGMVYVFFVLDLLLAALVVLTFGRRERRPARRRATPAPR
jgi:biotin transporter BioY